MHQADSLTFRAQEDELVLGRYRLVRRLGAGGMGTVHLAHDTKLDRAVAVKRIAIDDPAVAKRAAREAKAAARLAHPSIVALYEAGQDDDAVYLVSELVRGRTLARLIADGELSDRDVLEIGAALCDALAHAHKRGVVHRDVKPQNVIVPDSHREGDAAKLTDFGIAMLLGEDVLTRTGDIVGTLAYMAPEQAEGREVTAQADLYALALVIYEALSGTNPIRSRTPASTARRVGIRLPPLGRLRRDLPLELCEAIDRAVAPAPADRGTVAALRAELKRHIADADDEPGTVEGGALEPVSRLAVPRRAEAIHVWDDATAEHRGRARHAPETLAGRIVAGLIAGGLSVALAAWVDPLAGASPFALGGGAAVAVAALPRLGWCALLLGAVGVLAGTGHAGLATVIAFGAVPATVLLWSAPAFAFGSPALAPLLGVIAAGGVWPAIAGQARTALHRAALGWLGAWWLALAEVMTGRTLLLGPPSDALPRSGWDGSVTGAFSHAIGPAFSPAVLAIAAVWALAAAVLPVLVRGRVAAVDMLAATLWSAGVASGTQYAAQAVAQGDGAVEVRGLIVGAVAAGLGAVAFRASRAAV